MGKSAKFPYREWELDFISCDLNYVQFGELKGMAREEIFALNAYAKKHNWLEKRERFFEKARERFMAKAPDVVADKWVEQRGLVSSLYRHLKRSSEKLIQEEDPAIMARIAKDIASTIDTLVKTESFMGGGPTERVENKNLNLHGQFMDAVRERDKQRGIGGE